VRRHRAEDTHRHLQAIGHENGDAFTFHSNFLEPLREAGNRTLVLSERQAAVFANQRLPIGSSSDNILQSVKDCGITWRVGWNC
jgi:hypothetical protein